MANCQADNANYLHFIEMIKHRLPNTKFEFFEIPPTTTYSAYYKVHIFILLLYIAAFIC